MQSACRREVLCRDICVGRVMLGSACRMSQNDATLQWKCHPEILRD